MKYYILKEIQNYLSQFNTLKYIKRVDNNTLKMEFDKKNIIYFDLTKSNTLIYKKEINDNRKKDFQAPFDVILQKRLTNSSIKSIELFNDDKIILFTLRNKSAYKSQTTKLYLEFTGKYTNAIITDENDTILEALRHIDEWSSVRVIKVGLTLKPLEKPSFSFEQKSIENIEEYLYDVFTLKQQTYLQSIKKQKISQIQKQQKKVQKLLSNLEDIDELEKQVISFNEEANVILASLYEYSGYEKNIRIEQSNTLFKKSKKAKQKATNQYLEKTNLEQKEQFYTRLIQIIQECKTIEEIEFYLPKKEKNQQKTKKSNPYQSFFIDGYKIMLGRDERENIYLLQNSRASDFWFHLQGQVSSHVIVKNTKKTLPEHIIEYAAKICAKFSVNGGGVYEVDYTQRRNVKIQNRANVLYNPYTTTVVKI